MLSYFTHLTNFKHFGSSTCSYVHNQSHDTYGQPETEGLNLNRWTCWRSKVFEIRQMLLMLFCLKKDQFWFLLMLRTSSAEVHKKFLQGFANCSAPKTVIGVRKVANERYLPYLQLCGNASMWIFMYCRCKSGPKLR